MPSTHDQIEVNELQVNRHVRMRSPLGRLDVHASETTIGVWMQPKGMTGANGQFGCFIQGDSVCLAWYPTKDAKLPNAITSHGVQLIKSDGKPIIVPFSKLAELAEAMMKADASPRSGVTETANAPATTTAQVLERIRNAESQQRQHRQCEDVDDNQARKGARGETLQFWRAFSEVMPQFENRQPNGLYTVKIEVRDLSRDEAYAIRNAAVNEYASLIHTDKPYMG